MEPGRIEELTKTTKSFGETFQIVQPGIVAHLYLPGPVRPLGPLAADCIERFLSFIGRRSITHYWADNGYMKPLDDRRLNRDLKGLRNLSDKADEFSIEYTDIPHGGSAGQSIYLLGRQGDPLSPDQLSLIRFEFLPNALDQLGETNLIRFVLNEATQLQAQSGNLGWSFKRGGAFESEATREVNKLLPRYLGFDPCYRLAARKMRGHTAWAHWINLVHRDLFEQCGGEAVLRRETPNAELATADELYVIRGSKIPPVGDVNRGAKDLGELPGVARFLKPTRIQLTGLGDSEFDAEAWLARFDDLELRPWDNSGVVS